ncbi:MAG: thiamine biosynthesis protein ThiS [Rubritepida sp.]|nr:thiamine biosynthesis protein ThiS [Rubritepida sp.]
MPDTLPSHATAEIGVELSLTVNGEARSVPEGASVTDLLATIGLAERKVAVERNLEIVPRSQYSTTLLCAGDALEIVHFIGGG